ASEANDRQALQRATKLNPNDSGTQMRLARAESANGSVEAKLAALRTAADVSATNVAVQGRDGRGRIGAGRERGAEILYSKILARWPKNVDALVNYGLLAARMAREDEAMDAWQKAVDLSPGQANAQVYLAEGLEQRGEMQAAARHYRAYLEAVAVDASEHR